MALKYVSLVLIVLLLLIRPAQARLPTEADYATLANDIKVVHQSEFAQLVIDKNWQAIADAYNLAQAPDYWAWRSSLREQEIYEATSPDGTTWTWSTFKSQAVQERDAWDTMMHPGVINPSLAQTRAAFANVFGGQGASAQQNAFLLALSRRLARRIEVLYVSTGNGSTATPSNLRFEGTVTALDIAHAVDGVPLGP